MLKKILNGMSILLMIIFLVSFGVLAYFVFKLNVIPTKYLLVGCASILVVLILVLLLLFKFKNIVLKIIGLLLVIGLSICCLVGTKYIRNTYDFFKNVKKERDILTYSIIVLKENGYENLNDLNNKTILYLDDSNLESVRSYLKNKFDYIEKVDMEFGSIPEKLLTKEVDAIVIEESYVALAREEICAFSDKIEILDTFDVEIEAYKEKNDSDDLTLEPFILYISGIDQYGNVNSVRGRSDVNQLLIVNPKTNHILIVNTPRDYYVQLDGTTGLRDKLTHAGVYGINKSIKTLENFYNIDIDHYLRVNFNTLVKIVDIIGGIDVESDKSFQSSHIRDWHVEKGMNHMDGAKALAYSRERYAYLTGDHHRGANQQQVITAIIDKITTSSVLISKYNSILSTLDKTFQTDMDMSEITGFIKYQIDKMPTWTIESYAVSGFGSMDYTYSMGSKLKLYVMEPDMKTVNVAKSKIKEVLDED